MGLFEILIIAVVTLLVVGPERMPEAVRAIALNVGRIKRTFQSAKSEIEEHIGADDIRRQLRNEEIMASVDASREKMAPTVIDDRQEPKEDPPAKTETEISTKSYTADSSL